MDGISSEGFDLQRSKLAATLDLRASHLLHSFLPSLFRLSPATETPRTAFLVHNEPPSLRIPHPIECDRAMKKTSLSSRRRRESRANLLGFFMDLCDFIIRPRNPIEMVYSGCYTGLAGQKPGYFPADPPR